MSSNDLFETLETEFKELIEKVETEVLELENSKNPEVIHSIFRAIHTIKGNSAMFGMDKLRGISHSMETLFSKIRSKEIELKTDMIEIILKSIDRMKVIIFDLKNESNFEIKDLITTLDKYIEKKDSEIIYKDNSDTDDYSSFIESAKKENQFLSLVDVNFAANPSYTLDQWIQKMNSLESNILQKRVNNNDVVNISLDRESYPLPYSILILTSEQPEIFLENNSIPYSSIKKLHSIEVELPKATTTSETSRAHSYLKVPTKVLDDLINLAGEAVIARNQLFSSLNLEEDSEEEIRMNRVSQFINSIYNRLMKVRLQKLNSIFPRLQRVVRDASKFVGKDVRIELEGHDIELDEVVIEGITESLMHIIRNSIDHGIESAEERILNGKNPQGEILFKASLLGGNINIEIKDDGKGLNFDRIKIKAIEKKLISKEEAELLTKEQLTDLIFLPGFSTNEQVSEVSGRGVGMDVVLTNFKKFGGSVKINSEPGKGTIIRGMIPQTLSVIPAFIISISGYKFAILQKHIEELNKYDSSKILNIDNSIIYKKDEKLIPMLDLGELLFPEVKKANEPENIAILKSEEKTFAISFNHIVSIEEIVLKPVPIQIKEIELYGGTTVTGDGSAILLLEPEGLLKFSKIQIEKETITENQSKVKSAVNKSYLAFEIVNQMFLIEASEIQQVWKINRNQIQFTLDIEMIQLDDTLIPSFRLESLFNLNQIENPENLYCLVFKNSEKLIGIPFHNLIDILDSIEIKENNIIHNDFVDGVCLIENSMALYISLSKIFQNKNGAII